MNNLTKAYFTGLHHFATRLMDNLQDIQRTSLDSPENNLYWFTLRAAFKQVADERFIDSISIINQEGYHYENYLNVPMETLSEQIESLKSTRAQVKKDKEYELLYSIHSLGVMELVYFDLLSSNALDFLETLKEVIEEGLVIECTKGDPFAIYTMNRGREVVNAMKESREPDFSQWTPPFKEFLESKDTARWIALLLKMPKGPELGFVRGVLDGPVLSKGAFREEIGATLPASGSLCQLCHSGYISEAYSSYGCTNKNCLWGVKRHYSPLYSKGYLYPDRTLGNIPRYYYPMGSEDIKNLEVGKPIKVTLSFFNEKGKEGYELVEGLTRDDIIEVVDKREDHGTVIVMAKVKKIGDVSKETKLTLPENKLIAICSLEEVEDALIDLFEESHPKLRKPLLTISKKKAKKKDECCEGDIQHPYKPIFY